MYRKVHKVFHTCSINFLIIKTSILLLLFFFSTSFVNFLFSLSHHLSSRLNTVPAASNKTMCLIRFSKFFSYFLSLSFYIFFYCYIYISIDSVLFSPKIIHFFFLFFFSSNISFCRSKYFFFYFVFLFFFTSLPIFFSYSISSNIIFLCCIFFFVCINFTIHRLFFFADFQFVHD